MPYTSAHMLEHAPHQYGNMIVIIWRLPLQFVIFMVFIIDITQFITWLYAHCNALSMINVKTIIVEIGKNALEQI